ncbi:MAG: LptF/LptG family permease [Sedimentisphaerales bacterium]|nr:LptF/LptG family permease [Sedimentisphaerales bacterium]
MTLNIRKSKKNLEYDGLWYKLRPKLLDSYVAREYLFSYVVAVTVLLSLRMLLDLFAMFDEFVEKSSPDEVVTTWTIIGRIASYYGPQLLMYFRDFSGVMVLIAAIFALMRMTRQNELTAVLASGVSLKRLIAPVVFLGFCLNIVMVVDQEMILPGLADKLVRQHDETESRQRVVISLLNDRGESLLCARQFDPDAETMYGMLVIERDEGRMVGCLMADEARWDGENSRWILTNGKYENMRATDTVGYDPGIVDREYYDSDLSADYLWLQRNSGFKSLMSSGDLGAYLQRTNLKPADRAEAMGERHFRFTDPIINMVMLLMGLPLLVSREQRSSKTAVFLCLLGAGGCYLATFACKLLVGTNVPVLSEPLLAAWLPIIVFVPVSVLALDEVKT